MRGWVLMVTAILFVFAGCHEKWINVNGYDYRVPRVLFLTTGDGRGEGTVSDGAIVALQAFNKFGAYVRFENRTFLWNEANLDGYDIIIAPTLYGYHDADRMYSLTYLDDRELAILRRWVKKGGVLVAGENFGRNRPDGVDRVTLAGELSAKNWVFGTVVGAPLQEIDVKNFRLSAADFLSHDYPNPLILQVESSNYILIPSDSTSQAIFQDSSRYQVWFRWQDLKSGKVYPAVFTHQYGAGQMVYFTVSRILHPALDGGLSGTLQIENLYRQIYQLVVGKRNFPITLNSWPNAAQGVLAVTFDDGGTLEEYKLAFTSLFPYVENISLFITGYVPDDIVEWCRRQSQIRMQNHSFTHPRFRELDYLGSLKEIRLTELRYRQQQFTGFRFPFVVNSFWGLFVLDELGYSFESSIVVDHTRFYGGGLFPYNLPVFHRSGLVKSLDLLEISPLQHDDWHFYGTGVNEQKTYPEFQQKRDAARFGNYLTNFWNEVVVPEKGIMTIVAHPLYSGRNQILLAPILELAREVNNSGKYWLPSLQDVAEYWSKRKDLQVEVSEKKRTVSVTIRLPEGVSIPGLSLKLPVNPKEVQQSNGSGKTKSIDGKYYFVFDARNGQRIEFRF